MAWQVRREPQSLKRKAPLELQLRGGFSIGGEANGLSLHFLFLLYAIPRKSQALRGKFTELTGTPVALPLGELARSAWEGKDADGES